MSKCPFCGNEIDEHDFMCIHCGNILPVREDNSVLNQERNQDSFENKFSGGAHPYEQNSGADAGISSYSQSNGWNNGMNPYDQSNGWNGGMNPYDQNNDWNNSNNQYSGNYTGLNTGYDPYGQNNGANQGYDPYGQNNSLVGSSDYGNSTSFSTDGRNKKKKNVKTIVGMTIFIVMLVIGMNIYSVVQQRSYKKYDSIVNQAVTSVIEEDINSMSQVMAFDFDKIVRDFSSNMYSQVNALLIQNNENAVNNLKQVYGNNYTIQTTIKDVDELTGKEKKEAITSAENDIDSLFYLAMSNRKGSDYINVDKIHKVIRIRVDVVIKGDISSKKKVFWVDLMRYIDRNEWKVLEIYEKRE